MTDFGAARTEALHARRATARLADLDADRLGDDGELVELVHRLGGDVRGWWTSRRQHEIALWRLEEGSYTTDDVENAAEVHAAARTSVVQTCAAVVDRAARLHELAEQEAV